MFVYHLGGYTTKSSLLISVKELQLIFSLRFSTCVITLIMASHNFGHTFPSNQRKNKYVLSY